MPRDSHATVLTIEDEAVVRQSIVAYLQDQGYMVLEAADGRVGLEVFRRELPDAVLVDLRMPEVDGLEVLKTIVRESPDTPIIVVSGTGVLADAVEALRAGAWDFVLKPIMEMAVLHHAIRNGLERTHLLRENRRYQERLEDQVKERTAQLEATNDALTREIEDHQRAEEERRSLEAQLRHSQKLEAVGQLAGGVAHDFNNILTTIFGNIELTISALGKERPPIATILEQARQIEQGAQRASALTRRLLAFSRRQVCKPEIVDLNATLNDVSKMLGQLLEENIHVTMNLSPVIPRIRIDAGQMEQIVINLAVNARDAMRDGGRLTIETSETAFDDGDIAAHPEVQPGAYAMLSVRDTGVGMTPDIVERIFEPFFTTKALGQGTGLGLSTVYGIVKQAGGHVAVESRPQAGTTFRVYLPAVDAPVSRRAETRFSDDAPTGDETILLCEDDIAVRELTELLLVDAGYTVLTAASGRRAVALAEDRSRKIDLLITDVVMPDMDGRELAQALAAEHPDLMVLFVSGYTADVIAHHGVLDAGVEFLEKPFNRRTLLNRVRDVLDKAACTSDTTS